MPLLKRGLDSDNNYPLTYVLVNMALIIKLLQLTVCAKIPQKATMKDNPYFTFGLP